MDKDGGQAFPEPFRIGNQDVFSRGGMTMRDYFAGQIISNISASAGSLQQAVEVSYAVADLMLKERQKNGAS